MAGSDNLAPLPLPGASTWSAIDIVCGKELHGGYQSRVFSAEHEGRPVVVKLVDRRMVDRAFSRRVEMTSRLARIDPIVVGPSRIENDLVLKLDDWLVVGYPYVDGRNPRIDDESDVRRMARSMANLHHSLRQLDGVDLPMVAALRATEVLASEVGFSEPQLLHGDFSEQNVLLSDLGVQIIDFDDCGYGPIEFEVGNTLYMVLFDAWTKNDMTPYEQFRSWFVDEYWSVSGQSVSDGLIDAAIRLRTQALAQWIEKPEGAPIFARTTTPAWRETLREFVQSQLLP